LIQSDAGVIFDCSSNSGDAPMNSNSTSNSLSHFRRPRRSFLQLAGFALSARALAFGHPGDKPSQSASDAGPAKFAVSDSFPTQPEALVREMVTVSHFDLKRVQQLVDAQPSLARASWDWGFGDWESALGAASHMGNRPIAEYLIANGARPSFFSSAMLGHLDVVKAFVAAQPAIQRIRGPHSISLLAHAKAGGDAARPVYDFLLTLGDAGADPQVTVSQDDIDAVVGVYPFGAGENEQVQVTAEKGTVTWTRKGTMGRPLFHLGGREFYPWGAAAVRIRFKVDGAETMMTVNDPGLVMSAVRKK
jgi:hypothetical protein